MGFGPQTPKLGGFRSPQSWGAGGQSCLRPSPARELDFSHRQNARSGLGSGLCHQAICPGPES